MYPRVPSYFAKSKKRLYSIRQIEAKAIDNLIIAYLNLKSPVGREGDCGKQ